MADEPNKPATKDDTPDPKDQPAPDSKSSSSEGDPDGTDWRKHARTWEQRAKESADELEKLKAATQSDHEKEIEKARKEARAEAESEALGTMVETTLEAVASEKLAHASDIRMLDDYADRASVFVSNGKPDRAAMTKALDALVKKRPELGKAGSRPAPLKGGAGSGDSSGFDMNDEIRRQAGR